MADLIPREVLFGNPERTSPRISPDGTQLAWIAPRDGVLNVWVAPIGASGPSGVDWDAATVVTDDTDRGIRVFAWARDGRHLLYSQDTGGDENWRLYDVDMETMARRDLTPFDDITAHIVATSKRHRDEILVGINRDNPQLHDVYHLDLPTGELVKQIENPGYAGWIADEDLVVRGAVAPLPDGGFDLLVRDSAGADWRTLVTIPADDAPASDVLSFSGDGRSLLAISSEGTDTGRLCRVDLATGDIQVLLEDPDADVAGAILHPDTRDPQIVEVLKDRTEYHVLDPSVEEDF
jgi:Tol biopolymer transport system component